ncbi:DUF3889 domain-containing protein [Fredinandcohnia humi]
MKKATFVSFICGFILLVGGLGVSAQQQPPQQQPQKPPQQQQLPTDYEKWGRIAVDVAKLSYTNGKISDYQYKGREEITETQAKDTFELKVQTQERSFTARVMILFNPKTDTLLSLSIEEVK